MAVKRLGDSAIAGAMRDAGAGAVAVRDTDVGGASGGKSAAGGVVRSFASVTKGGGVELSQSVGASSKQSFAAKFRSKPKDTVVVLGDSLVRGAGRHLERDSHMYTAVCKPGARIEHVTREVSALPDRSDRHLVVLAGTNNLREGTETVMRKFEDLVGACMEVRSRKLTIVGILLRYHVSSVRGLV